MSTTQRFYDDLADDYHLIFRDWEKAVDRQGQVLDELIRARCPRARTLLDCACGIGTQSFGLAARGWRVTGSDLSPGAIGRAPCCMHTDTRGDHQRQHGQQKNRLKIWFTDRNLA